MGAGCAGSSLQAGAAGAGVEGIWARGAACTRCERCSCAHLVLAARLWAAAEVTLTPRVADDAALARWVDLFSAANDEGAVDASTGVVRLRLGAPLAAWLDFVVMTPEWQLARSNWGSYVLLRRQGEPAAP